MGFQYCNICNMSISLLKLKHEVFFPPRHTFRQWLRSKSNSRTLLRTSLAETLSSDILIAANCTALAACSPKVLTAGFRCPCSFFVWKMMSFARDVWRLMMFTMDVEMFPLKFELNPVFCSLRTPSHNPAVSSHCTGGVPSS
jgi:hypothetical protein